jgi:hypothetical protein
MEAQANPIGAAEAKRMNAMLKSGASDSSIRAYASYLGNVDLGSVEDALTWRRRNPNYSGDYNFAGFDQKNVPMSLGRRLWNETAQSPVGVAAIGAYSGVNDLSFGLANKATGHPDQMQMGIDAVRSKHPVAFIGGEMIPMTAAAAGFEAGLPAAAAASGLRDTSLVARALSSPISADLVAGGYQGAGASPDNRIAGLLIGAGTAGVGGVIGRNVIGPGGAVLARTRPGRAISRAGNAITNGVRRAFNADEVPLTAIPAAPTKIERILLGSIRRAGPEGVTDRLGQASNLNVPMSLADTDPVLRELAGAAVRRSPIASALAEDSLLPRARGQYDRFTSSVNSNLGSTANIPQLSADLTAQGRSAASDLYDRAYAAPVPSTPQLDAVLSTPFGQQALRRARTIAANEMRAPEELGFALDADGNVLLNPRPSNAIARHLDARAELDDAQQGYKTARQSPDGNVDSARNRVLVARENLRQAEGGLAAAPDPSMPASVPAYTTQTLDYVKRGMDDVLEQYRNPITGKLALDEAGRAQNAVRGQLLNEIDRLNPDYAAARAAYAGPVASRDALARGGDAYSLQPDELAMQVSNQSPEHLGQMQLGYRGAMVDHAGRIRDSGNPWDATLGSPVARQRLQAMYSGNAGVDRLLDQQALEKQLAQTTNAILGNSRTARNVIADQQFANPVVEGALHAGAAVATHGASVPGTAARLAGAGLRGRLALGIGKRAEEKAEALIPYLLNTDPTASSAVVDDLMNKSSLYDAYIEAQRDAIARKAGVAGAAGGANIAALLSQQ